MTIKILKSITSKQVNKGKKILKPIPRTIFQKKKRNSSRKKKSKSLFEWINKRFSTGFFSLGIYTKIAYNYGKIFFFFLLFCVANELAR